MESSMTDEVDRAGSVMLHDLSLRVSAVEALASNANGAHVVPRSGNMSRTTCAENSMCCNGNGGQFAVIKPPSGGGGVPRDFISLSFEASKVMSWRATRCECARRRRWCRCRADNTDNTDGRTSLYDASNRCKKLERAPVGCGSVCVCGCLRVSACLCVSPCVSMCLCVSTVPESLALLIKRLATFRVSQILVHNI